MSDNQHENMVRVGPWEDPITGTVSEAWVTLEEAAALERGESISRRGERTVDRWTLGEQATALRARLDQVLMERQAVEYRHKRERAREEGLLDVVDRLDDDERAELLALYPWLEETE